MAVAIIGFFVVTLGLLYVTTRMRANAALAVPLFKISECPPDRMVRLVGYANPYQPLTAPFSGRPCLGYQTVVKFGNRTFTNVMIASFTLTDETGTAVIDIRGKPLPMMLLPTHSFSGGSIFSRLSASQYPALRELGLELCEGAEEHIIGPEAIVTVIGYAVHDPVPAADGYRTGSRGAVRVVRPQAGPWSVWGALPVAPPPLQPQMPPG